MIRLKQAAALAATALMLSLVPVGVAMADHHEKANPCNPCAEKKNPCNPCEGKEANPCNPCNPCAGKKANPCSGK
jgi:hypothetical protein